MRCATASQFSKTNRRRAPLQVAPREGTRTREAYDLFKANAGKPVEYSFGPDRVILVRLTDFYGFDIRRLQRGNYRAGRKPQYVLAGEWFGRVYVDYIAEQLQ